MSYMPTIEDHSFLKICAQLASCLSISISAAKKKIVLDELKQKKPRARSILSTSPKKKRRKSVRSKQTKTR